MTPDDRLNAAIAAFRSLDAPPAPSWHPPTAVVAGSKHSRRRLVMKLGLGGLAAMVALAAGLMLAATPAVTMAQAAEAVKAKKLVRYKEGQLSRPVDKEWDAVKFTTFWHCEDLTQRRSAGVAYTPEQGELNPAVKGFSVIDGASRRFLEVSRTPKLFCEALAAGEPPADERSKAMAVVGLIPKAKLAETLARPGWLARLARVSVAGADPDWGTEDVDLAGKFNRPHLLDRIKTLAESKASTTTREQLDGKPAVKIVGTEEMRAVTVWLDPATKLPLRIERALEGPPGKFIVESGFEWDFALPAGLTLEALFSTEPPPGVALTLVVE